jgi:hypothetical protein
MTIIRRSSRSTGNRTMPTLVSIRTAAIGLLLLSLSGCVAVTPAASESSTSPESASGAPQVTAGAEALDVLADIPIKGRAPKTGYDREGHFGTAWLDVDRNGCDTRNDILARDLESEVLEGPCKVISGTLNDTYTGATIEFVRGNKTSMAVQIDHRVALMNAWETGAQQMTQDARVALANDPINLVAVDGPSNSQKGAGDAATWLPPVKAIRCDYVTKQILVKAKYGLWVTQAEHDIMVRELGTCTAAAPVEAAPVTPPAPAVEGPVASEPPFADEVAAPVAGTIHPGGFCDVLGATGTADTGKTYTCGANGADAAGRFHWNA